MKRDMRRSDRLVTDRDTIEVFLDEAKVIHLGLEDDGEIYVVPLNYGWEWKGETLMLYCHSAREGRKIDLIGKGTKVGFSMESGISYFGDEMACHYGNYYKSIIGSGEASLLKEDEARSHALNQIMAHYSDRDHWHFAPEMLAQVEVIAVCVQDFSCKIHGEPQTV